MPVELAFNFDSWERRRQGAAGHDMFGPDRILGVVEVGEVAGAHVDSPDAEPHLLGVDPTKSIKRSSVGRSAPVSYQLVAAAVPFGCRGGRRKPRREPPER